MTSSRRLVGNADTVIDELGFGRFQIQPIIFIIIAMFLDGMGTAVFIFTTLDSSPYRCKITECEGPDSVYSADWLSSAIPNAALTYDKCTRYSVSGSWNGTVVSDCSYLDFNTSSVTGCTQWVFAPGDTIVSEFELACDSWRTALVGTMNGVGSFVCLMYVGFLSDKFGRRLLLIFSTVARGVVGLAQSFSPEYWSFLSLEFINTLLSAGGYSAAYVLGAELFSSKYRVTGTMVITLSAGFSSLTLGALAYYVPYWRNLLRVVYVPGILYILFMRLIPESARWLIVRQRYAEAVRIITNAARSNRVKFTEHTQSYIDNLRVGIVSQEIRETTEKVPFLALFRSWRLSLRLIVCALCWITNVLVYYALTINSVNISTDNAFLNYLLVSGAEISSLIVYYIFVDRLGRKLSLSGSLVTCGLMCFAYAFTPSDMVVLALVFYIGAKLFISFAFNVVYIYTSELFPTTLRHTCLACCSMLGRIGNIVAPQTTLLSQWHSSLPMSMFAAISIASGLSTLIFPETLNTELPETIEDAEQIGEKRFLIEKRT